MALGKSKKNVVVFNSLLWATIGGFAIGLLIGPVILGQASLEPLRIIGVIPGIGIIFAASKGLHTWWGK